MIVELLKSYNFNLTTGVANFFDSLLYLYGLYDFYLIVIPINISLGTEFAGISSVSAN